MVLMLMSCGGGDKSEDSNATPMPITFEVVDQTLAEANKIVIQYAEFNRSVCVTIYDNMTALENKDPSALLFRKTFNKGIYRNEPLTINKNRANDDLLYFQIYEGDCSAFSSAPIAKVNGKTFRNIKVKLASNIGVIIESQTLTNIFQINIKSIMTETPVWMVAHLADDTQAHSLGDVMGAKYIEADDTSDVSFLLNTAVENNDILKVALYNNTSIEENEHFAPDVDTLITSSISAEATIKVPNFLVESRCDDCLHFSISGLGFGAYQWQGDAASESRIIPRENSSGDDDIYLIIGDKVEIINNQPMLHPFTLLNGNNDILLSQRENIGIFSDDVDVDWSYQDGTIIFTVTEELANELSQYQCSEHPSMKGLISTE